MLRLMIVVSKQSLLTWSKRKDMSAFCLPLYSVRLYTCKHVNMCNSIVCRHGMGVELLCLIWLWCQTAVGASQTADLLGFICTTVSTVENGVKNNIPGVVVQCVWKRLVNESGQRRMAELVQADRRAMVTQISTYCNRARHVEDHFCTNNKSNLEADRLHGKTTKDIHSC